MSEYVITIQVDEQVLRDSRLANVPGSEGESIQAAIEGEFGWLDQSGIKLLSIEDPT